jgi:hypothetical protein
MFAFIEFNGLNECYVESCETHKRPHGIVCNVTSSFPLIVTSTLRLNTRLQESQRGLLSLRTLSPLLPWWGVTLACCEFGDIIKDTDIVGAAHIMDHIAICHLASLYSSLVAFGVLTQQTFPKPKWPLGPAQPSKECWPQWCALHLGASGSSWHTSSPSCHSANFPAVGIWL